MNRNLIRALAACALVLGVGLTVNPVDATPTSEAAAVSVAQPSQPPSAATLCAYFAHKHLEGGTVQYAQYETLNTTYAEARCLHSWPVQGGYTYIVCGFYARVYSNGAWAGPYQEQCH